MEDLKLNSRAPLLYYFWIAGSIALLTVLLINQTNIYFAIINALVISLIFYLMFLSYASSIRIDQSLLRIKYLFPNTGTIEINLLEVEVIEFELSYFFLFEDDFKLGVFFLMHPYDTMIIHFKNSDKRIVKFNCSFFATRKMYLFSKSNFQKIKG